MEKKKTGLIITIILLVLCLGAIVIGLTYAWFQTSEEGSTNVIEVADGLSLELINEDIVSITDTMPMTDNWAIENIESYKFSLKNTGNENYSYTISMEHIVKELPESVIRYGISIDGGKTYSKIDSLTNFTYTNIINKGNTINLELKLWVDKETTIDYQNKVYEGRINVSGTVTNLSYVTAPDLTEKMVPIKWNGSSWVKADASNTDNDWYNYDEFKWANIALVNDDSLYTIQVNEEVPMDSILAMYVWIPRYRYKLWNAENGSSEPQEIDIVFEEVSQTKSNGSTNGTYLTHPAFTFGTDELNGIWVGKFETSANPDSECYLNPSEANCNEKIDTIMPRIVPNVDSLRYTSLLSYFENSKKFKNYGLTNATIDSHLIKNMEWGAVAYISHSKYGKYGNPSYEGANKEIYINNYRNDNSAYKTYTGCSAGSIGNDTTITATCSYTYEKELTGTGASTTGTIYGIYDMVGGNWDSVMANMQDSSGSFYPSNSGFTTLDTKYYDSYSYDATSELTYERGLLGDATKEIISNENNTSGGWNFDQTSFLYANNSWLLRGASASNGQAAGIFAFYYHHGASVYRNASRAVLIKN